MGGQIRVIIREEDGKVTKMSRWTNHLPYFVKNINFLNCNKEFIKEYINRKDSYTYYDDFMAPDGYGIVVFDFMKKKIYSKQGYCSFLEINNSELYLSNKSKLEVSKPEYTFDIFKHAEELVEAELVKYLQYSWLKDDYIDSKEVTEVNKFTLNEYIDDSFNSNIIYEIRDNIKRKLSKRDYRKIIEIDYKKAGWTLIEKGEGPEEEFEIYKSMVDDGFIFSQQDNQMWEDKLSDYIDEYGADEISVKKGSYYKYKRDKQINKILK